MSLLKASLGNSGWENLAMMRRRFFWSRTGTAFIHIPKAAGSSISHALYGRRLGHVRYRGIERRVPRVAQAMPVFSVMRDPGLRLISAYQYVKSGGTEDGAVYDLPVYHDPVFASFESFLFDWLPTVELADQDYVFQPQSSFLENAQGRVAPSIKLFTLEYGMPELSDYLSAFTATEISNQNANKTNTDVESMKRTLESDEGRRVIQDCYGRDLELYQSVRERGSLNA